MEEGREEGGQQRQQEQPRGVSLSPKSMVDSVADWSLRQVVDHLKKKEKDAGGQRYDDCHVTSRHCVRMLLSAVDELALRYNVSRARMSRWISYHAVAILQDDVVVDQLTALCAKARHSALKLADSDSLAVLNNLGAYHPDNIAEASISLYLYEPWMRSVFQEKAQVCGVRAFHLIQQFFLRSILTSDNEDLVGVLKMFSREVRRWDVWIARRLDTVDKVASGEIWGDSRTSDVVAQYHQLGN